jgi:RecA/RadA recombinase
MDLVKDLLLATGNDLAGIVENGVAAGDVEEYIDTGSYVLNALLSGSLYGGVASNKVTAFAGETATGKTFFVLGLVKNFLDANPTACVVYFESESAITKDMIVARGIDSKRMIIVPVATVQEFRFQALKVLDKYIENQTENKPKLLLCLDSLGNLSTTKEIEDTAEGKETQDMTRARLIKGVFRVLTLKLAKAKCPMLITNHTYLQVGSMYPQQIMGGGAGLAYAASTIMFLSKRKEKDGDEVIGNIIHCKNVKNRFVKENRTVDVQLTYDKGLSKYYGLLDLAVKFGIWQEAGKRIQVDADNKVFRSRIYNDTDKYFTPEVMKKLEECIKQYFSYGSNFELVSENKEETEE